MYLSNLSIALHEPFERTQAGGRLDEAITAGRSAYAAALGDDPDRAAYLTNLGLALRARFERSGTLADLDDAITASRQAVAATPTATPTVPRTCPTSALSFMPGSSDPGC